jgi:hypothetical protein
VHTSTYLPQYKVQNDDQEKIGNVASLHWKNFLSKTEVEMVSSNIGHNIYSYIVVWDHNV